jgi:hypothetical protein
VSRGGSAREQEDPEVCEGVGIANQSGPIGFSHKSTMSSSSYSSSIARARPQHLEEAPGPPSEPLRSLYARTSLPWQSRLPPPRVTVRNIPPAILQPLQLFPPASFFVTHGILPPSNTFHRQSCYRGNSLSARSPPQPRLLQGFT